MVQPARRVPAEASRSFQRAVDLELADHLAQARERIVAYAPEAATLIAEVTRLVEAGGKRLRPLFCYWGHRAAGGKDGTAIVRVGSGIELLHTSAIIHDDVMDRSGLRRGEQTAFVRSGASGAILAGDIAQALADELLVESGFPAERILAAFSHFNRMRVEAVSGEFLDLLTAGQGAAVADEARARRVAALKSGSYSVVGPLLVGASLAGAEGAVLSALRAYGEPLGEAFQLRDDLLGTFGDPALTGKDSDGDIRHGKRSTLVAKALRLGSPDARRVIMERLGREGITPEEVEEVRAAIRGSGALGETVELIHSLAAEAQVVLAAAPIEPEAAEGLSALADLIAVRDA